jgi:hypothetical protein
MTDPPRTRTGDYETSNEGAIKVATRAGAQKMELLKCFAINPHGLTDEQAADSAKLIRTCYWKRCGELRAAGLIEFTGDTRVGIAGVRRRVSIITERGRSVVQS